MQKWDARTTKKAIQQTGDAVCWMAPFFTLSNLCLHDDGQYHRTATGLFKQITSKRIANGGLQ